MFASDLPSTLQRFIRFPPDFLIFLPILFFDLDLRNSPRTQPLDPTGKKYNVINHLLIILVTTMHTSSQGDYSGIIFPCREPKKIKMWEICRNEKYAFRFHAGKSFSC